MYERIDSKGNVTRVVGQNRDLDGYLPSDHQPLPWREHLLHDPSVESIVIPSNSERLFNAASIEPWEEMVLLFGLAKEGTFFPLDSLPISHKRTSFAVNEISVSDEFSAYHDSLYRFVKALIPGVKCVLAHTHPFAEENKLRRVMEDKQRANFLVDVITHGYDMGEFPQFKELGLKRGCAAAINASISSELSLDDMRFPGPKSYQLLVSENPIGRRANYSFFRVSDDAASQLEAVQFTDNLPEEFQDFRQLLKRNQELVSLVSERVVENFHANRAALPSEVSHPRFVMYKLSGLVSEIIRDELFADIVKCTVGELSEEDLLCRAKGFDLSKHLSN